MDEKLGEKLKELGLAALENHAKLALNDIEALGKLVVESTPNSFDNIGFAAFLSFKGELLKVLDKIDGKVSI